MFLWRDGGWYIYIYRIGGNQDAPTHDNQIQTHIATRVVLCNLVWIIWFWKCNGLVYELNAVGCQMWHDCVYICRFVLIALYFFLLIYVLYNIPILAFV